jgi:hypothetical protein
VLAERLVAAAAQLLALVGLEGGAFVGFVHRARGGRG